MLFEAKFAPGIAEGSVTLKALGLTLSLTVGYELSPRGQAYLDHLG